MPKFQLLVNPLNVSNTSTPYRALSHLISCQALRRRLGLLRGVEVTPRAFARPLRRQGVPFRTVMISNIIYDFFGHEKKREKNDFFFVESISYCPSIER